jgi:hypothetical protein
MVDNKTLCHELLVHRAYKSPFSHTPHRNQPLNSNMLNNQHHTTQSPNNLWRKDKQPLHHQRLRLNNMTSNININSSNSINTNNITNLQVSNACTGGK